MLELLAGLSEGVLVGGVATGEFAPDAGCIRACVELWLGDGAYFTDLACDSGGNGDFLSDPRRHFARWVFDGTHLHAGFLVVDLRDAPHFTALDEHLARLGEVDHEPLV